MSLLTVLGAWNRVVTTGGREFSTLQHDTDLQSTITLFNEAHHYLLAATEYKFQKQNTTES